MKKYYKKKTNNRSKWFLTSLEDRIVYCGTGDSDHKRCRNWQDMTAGAKGLFSQNDGNLLFGENAQNVEEIFKQFDLPEKVLTGNQQEQERPLQAVQEREVGRPRQIQEEVRNLVSEGSVNKFEYQTEEKGKAIGTGFTLSKVTDKKLTNNGSLYYLQDTKGSGICVKWSNAEKFNQSEEYLFRTVIREQLAKQVTFKKYVDKPEEQDIKEVKCKHKNKSINLEIQGVYCKRGRQLTKYALPSSQIAKQPSLEQINHNDIQNEVPVRQQKISRIKAPKVRPPQELLIPELQGLNLEAVERELDLVDLHPEKNQPMHQENKDEAKKSQSVKKTVKFNDVVQVKEFEIDEGNTLHKKSSRENRDTELQFSKYEFIEEDQNKQPSPEQIKENDSLDLKLDKLSKKEQSEAGDWSEERLQASLQKMVEQWNVKITQKTTGMTTRDTKNQGFRATLKDKNIPVLTIQDGDLKINRNAIEPQKNKDNQLATFLKQCQWDFNGQKEVFELQRERTALTIAINTLSNFSANPSQHSENENCFSSVENRGNEVEQVCQNFSELFSELKDKTLQSLEIDLMEQKSQWRAKLEEKRQEHLLKQALQQFNLNDTDQSTNLMGPEIDLLDIKGDHTFNLEGSLHKENGVNEQDDSAAANLQKNKETTIQFINGLTGVSENDKQDIIDIINNIKTMEDMGKIIYRNLSVDESGEVNQDGIENIKITFNLKNRSTPTDQPENETAGNLTMYNIGNVEAIGGPDGNGIFVAKEEHVNQHLENPSQDNLRNFFTFSIPENQKGSETLPFLLSLKDAVFSPYQNSADHGNNDSFYEQPAQKEIEHPELFKHSVQYKMTTIKFGKRTKLQEILLSNSYDPILRVS